MQFSEKGSSAREREEATYMHFLVYLQNCEKSTFLFFFLYNYAIFICPAEQADGVDKEEEENEQDDRG